jgi:hypothetical protein
MVTAGWKLSSHIDLCKYSYSNFSEDVSWLSCYYNSKDTMFSCEH